MVMSNKQHKHLCNQNARMEDSTNNDDICLIKLEAQNPKKKKERKVEGSNLLPTKKL